MSEDKLDNLLKDIFQYTNQKDHAAGRDCLSDEELAEYAGAVISDGLPREDWANHINGCDFCFSKVASCIVTLTNRYEDSPKQGSTLQKAKSIPKMFKRPKGTKGPFKRNLFLFVTAFFFVLSFVVKRYFLQFLAASIIFGFKWVMDTGGSKALIMIYDAWHTKKSQDKQEAQRERDKSHTRI